jgi:4-hydroxy-tetrahydrodipicolinate synthase
MNSKAGFVHPAKPTMFGAFSTPMDKNGDLDEEGIRRHLRRMIDAGVGVYVGSGGSGDGHALSPEELGELCRIAVDEADGRIPIYCMSSESRTAKEMIAKGRQAINAGVDLMQYYQVDLGHGMVPTVSEQEAYFRDVLEELDHPCSLSVYPGAGYTAPTSLIAKLCNDYPQVKVINYFGPGMKYMTDLMKMVNPDVKFYVGMFTLLSALPLGAWGAQVPETNQIPNICRSIIDYYLAGDTEKMREAYTTALSIGEVIALGHGESSGSPKAASNALGYDIGPPRRPRLPASPETIEKMRLAFEALNIPELEKQAAMKLN